MDLKQFGNKLVMELQSLIDHTIGMVVRFTSISLYQNTEDSREFYERPNINIT